MHASTLLHVGTNACTPMHVLLSMQVNPCIHALPCTQVLTTHACSNVCTLKHACACMHASTLQHASTNACTQLSGHCPHLPLSPICLNWLHLIVILLIMWVQELSINIRPNQKILKATNTLAYWPHDTQHIGHQLYVKVSVTCFRYSDCHIFIVMLSVIRLSVVAPANYTVGSVEQLKITFGFAHRIPDRILQIVESE